MRFYDLLETAVVLLSRSPPLSVSLSPMPRTAAFHHLQITLVKMIHLSGKQEEKIIVVSYLRKCNKSDFDS
jgi:hypothetical protein